MIDVEKIRQDFPMFKNHVKMHDHDLVYLDNNATTLKPKCVADAVYGYLTEYTSNAERGDYDLSHIVDTKFEGAREDVRRFIGAKDKREVIFTAGSTDSLNMVAYGYALHHLKEGDEILLSLAEHASNTLPWFDVAKMTGAKIKYIDLDEKGAITIENVKKAITDKTKIIALAIVTNVMGYIIPIHEITALAHKQNIVVVCDGAQSVPHIKTDVVADDIDFLAFSGHKMCGPTGIGVLYGKMALLEEMKPVRYGGGSNARYEADGELSLKSIPYRFESGTPNIEGVIGLGAAVRYLESIGIENIHAYEIELRKYAIEKLKQVDKVELYNPEATGAIAMNIKGVFSQDASSLFNTYGIAVRAGNHCAKILKDFLHVNATVRASLYFYNTKEDIDTFVEVCKKGDDFLDAFFG